MNQTSDFWERYHEYHDFLLFDEVILPILLLPFFFIYLILKAKFWDDDLPPAADYSIGLPLQK